MEEKIQRIFGVKQGTKLSSNPYVYSSDLNQICTESDLSQTCTESTLNADKIAPGFAGHCLQALPLENVNN